MLPIGDVNPRRHFPVATAVIIALNLIVFFYELTLPEDSLQSFVLRAGVVPYQVTNHFGLPAATSLFTSMFLHGGWVHIIGNMLYLWIFGDNIEDYLGTVSYVLFYFLAGLAAALAHIASDPSSVVPTIGASGAIAGVLGAYLVLFPRARVRTLIFIFRFIRFVELPALVVLGFWFILQLFSGLASIGAASGGGVAWFAHIGGFAAGLLAGLILKRQPKSKLSKERYP